MRDEPKNGCEGDYLMAGVKNICDMSDLPRNRRAITSVTNYRYLIPKFVIDTINK